MKQIGPIAAALALCAASLGAQAQLEKRVVLTGFALVLDWIVTLAETRLMVWQPRSGETERL